MENIDGFLMRCGDMRRSYWGLNGVV